MGWQNMIERGERRDVQEEEALPYVFRMASFFLFPTSQYGFHLQYYNWLDLFRCRNRHEKCFKQFGACGQRLAWLPRVVLSRETFPFHQVSFGGWGAVFLFLK